ncbi:P-loop containing nucleoside triphosphate hydrolase protein [Blakeslea trispora]|nr:P-loop containing nucleoside triphosphate hydrolase protein [Blakeslea trispora]
MITTNNAFVRKRTMSSVNKAESVQVTVRCRPPARNEQGNCWDIESSRIALKEELRYRTQHEFMFDHVLYGSDNKLIYDTTVCNLINQVMEGYNGTVFAYGQTASGKTFTMGNELEPGIIPRSIHNVFDYIKKAITREFLLRVSYLEIYNETIKDLLNPSNDNLKIHQDKIRGVFVSPLTEEVVTTPDDVLRIIQRGEANRHISSTDYNLHSSRSHTMFQMIIESREKSSTSTQLSNYKRTLLSSGFGTSKPKELVKISQLNLIDLAGSEKAASNEERRKEGSYINKSLLTLGTVISKLTESNGKSPAHIPFRDSKLTRILQTALTGQAKVAVICAISPSHHSIEESINTLKFASRVKRITIHAKNDAVMDDKALLQKYQSEIVELKSKLQSTAEVLEEEKQKIESAILAERMDHEQQMQRMQAIRNVMKERIDHLTRLILTSSSVVMTDATADLLTSPDDTTTLSSVLPPSPPMSEQNSTLLQHAHQNDKVMIQELKKQLYKMEQESREKDHRILALEEQLRQTTATVSKLETKLSIQRAELEINELLAKEHQTRSSLSEI